MTFARLEAGSIAPGMPTLDKVAAALGVELVVSFVDHQREDRGLMASDRGRWTTADSSSGSIARSRHILTV